jgi:hypothetical protein
LVSAGVSGTLTNFHIVANLDERPRTERVRQKLIKIGSDGAAVATNLCYWNASAFTQHLKRLAPEILKGFRTLEQYIS